MLAVQHFGVAMQFRVSFERSETIKEELKLIMDSNVKLLLLTIVADLIL